MFQLNTEKGLTTEHSRLGLFSKPHAASVSLFFPRQVQLNDFEMRLGNGRDLVVLRSSSSSHDDPRDTTTSGRFMPEDTTVFF